MIINLLVKDYSLIENVGNETRNQEDTNKIKEGLEEAFKVKSIAIPQDIVRKDFSKLFEAYDKLKGIKDMKTRSELHDNAYTIVRELRLKYSDFLTDNIAKRFAEMETYHGWKHKTQQAASLWEEVNNLLELPENLQEAFEKDCKGLKLILEGLEKYSSAATIKEIESIKKMAENIININQKTCQIVEIEYSAILRVEISTAKAVLWEIDNGKERNKPTVETLLNYLKTSKGWVGDDFEECMHIMNEARRF